MSKIEADAAAEQQSKLESEEHVGGLGSSHVPGLSAREDIRQMWQTSPLKAIWNIVVMVILLVIYFLAQYDKFVISYFQDEILRDLSISTTGYGLLTGYGTSVLSALTALPVAFIADYSEQRIWTLTIALIWWSLMVIFQGLSKNFWQIICARLGMSFAQSASEAISVSLISDIAPVALVPFFESLLYVGVYIGEAISSRISAIFKTTDTSWRVALKAIGIVGCVLALVLRAIAREPTRRDIRSSHLEVELAKDDAIRSGKLRNRIVRATSELRETLRFAITLRSFWLVTLSASIRQLSGNVFGFYMPSYLQLLYPNQTAYLITTYGIIVGTVGTFASLLGGSLSSAFSQRVPTLPLYLVAIGGVLSAPFVIVMVFSRELAGQNSDQGLAILFGSMTAAYLTAEMWLGPIAALIVRLFPIRFKTFSFTVYSLVNILVYSSGPEIVAIAQKRSNVDSTDDPAQYIRVTRVILAVVIPAGYVISAAGFLQAAQSPCYPCDLGKIYSSDTSGNQHARLAISSRRKWTFSTGFGLLCALVVGLIATSFSLGV